ncbi:MAG: hypothetical protein PHO32_06945, partial [Candidatus Cloacimonetes bacterium]|nr:hypothetical protein [Candidatus Cloacimonadota bacterium]
NPIAFVEFEDLSGKFEIPLFNRDYQQYFSQVIPGKVYFIFGTRSTFNGNDDGILRVMPQALIQFENLARELKGELKVTLSLEQIKKGLLAEIGAWQQRKPGKFKLQTQVQTSDLNTYLLESRRTFFPDNGILSWLEKHNVDFSVKVITNDKNS